MKPIEATFSLSYRSGDGVSVTIEDRTSKTVIFEGLISYEEFTSALSSLQSRPFTKAEFTSMPEVVGMKSENEQFSFQVDDTGDTWSDDFKARVAKYIKDNDLKPGWEVSSYLGSQGSIVKLRNGRIQINTWARRYV